MGSSVDFEVENKTDFRLDFLIFGNEKYSEINVPSHDAQSITLSIDGNEISISVFVGDFEIKETKHYMIRCISDFCLFIMALQMDFTKYLEIKNSRPDIRGILRYNYLIERKKGTKRKKFISIKYS